MSAESKKSLRQVERDMITAAMRELGPAQDYSEDNTGEITRRVVRALLSAEKVADAAVEDLDDDDFSFMASASIVAASAFGQWAITEKGETLFEPEEPMTYIGARMLAFARALTFFELINKARIQLAQNCSEEFDSSDAVELMLRRAEEQESLERDGS